ncbi:MAG: GIY-YIG nuclease family protein [Desulfurellales bacterium]|nr:MAG: GIY-YIG nuclease family protein [Desulfurellales bacterium]
MDGFIEASGFLRSGVYMLLFKGQVVYIGKAKSMLERVYAHRTHAKRQLKGKVPDWLPLRAIHFDQVLIRPCELAMLDALEQQLIAKHNPQYNTLLRSSTEVKLSIGGKEMVLKPKPVARRV